MTSEGASDPMRTDPTVLLAAVDPNAAPNDRLGDREELRRECVLVIKTCYDPEIPVDIWELGLIYDLNVTEERAIEVKMTLTSPMCPVAGTLPPQVETKLRALHWASDATVEVVWDPPWTPERMSELARLELNMPL